MAVQLNTHFTYKKLFRAVIPSILMMIFISIYSIVDGLFVSNFVGTTAFAGLNLVYPILMIVGALGFMIGSGGSALVSKTLGEGKKELANQYFSMFVCLTLILGITISTILYILTPEIAVLFGAEGEMIEYCVIYARTCLIFQTCFIVQNTFQSFFMTAEKPHLGLILSLISGVCNMILDAVFIVGFDMGIRGAALATGLCQTIGAVVPVFYFLIKKDLNIRLVRPKFDIKAMFKGCFNGISELVTNISASVVGIIYNYQLLRLAGENGIASYGVILYAQFVFLAVFFGYSMGTAPIIGFNYGANNKEELQNVFKKSIKVIGITSVILVLVAELIARPISLIFVSYDVALLNMTVRGFRIFAIGFIICGFNIFASAFYTALNNGLVSLILSLGRTFIFQILAVSILPILFDLDGVWLANVMVESLSIIMSLLFIVLMRNKYEYYGKINNQRREGELKYENI